MRQSIIFFSAGNSPKLLYKWQKEALTPHAAQGAELDPATAAVILAGRPAPKEAYVLS